MGYDSLLLKEFFWIKYLQGIMKPNLDFWNLQNVAMRTQTHNLSHCLLQSKRLMKKLSQILTSFAPSSKKRKSWSHEASFKKRYFLLSRKKFTLFEFFCSRYFCIIFQVLEYYTSTQTLDIYLFIKNSYISCLRDKLLLYVYLEKYKQFVFWRDTRQIT